MRKTNNLKAFTLAELLMVIAIVGSLSILALHSMRNSVDKEKTLYKKAYSNLEQTVNELVNDETLYPYDEQLIGFLNAVPVRIPGDTKCTNGETYQADNVNPCGTSTSTVAEKFSRLFKNQFSTLPMGTCRSFTPNYNDGDHSNPVDCFQSSDGVAWYIFEENGDKFQIVLDVNGQESGDNTYDNTARRDLFNIHIRPDGKVELKEDEFVEIAYLKAQDLRKNENCLVPNCNNCSSTFVCKSDGCNTGFTYENGLCKTTTP